MLRLRLASGLPLDLLDADGRRAAERAVADGLLEWPATPDRGRRAGGAGAGGAHRGRGWRAGSRADAVGARDLLVRGPRRRPAWRCSLPRTDRRSRAGGPVTPCARTCCPAPTARSRCGREPAAAAAAGPRGRGRARGRRGRGRAAGRDAGPGVDADARPAQDVLGPVLLVPGYGGAQAALEPLAGRIRATGRTATVVGAARQRHRRPVRPGRRARPGRRRRAGRGRAVGRRRRLLGGRGGGRAVGRPRRRGGQGPPGRHAGLAAARHRRWRAAPSRSRPTPARWPAGSSRPGSAEVRELATAAVGRRLPWLSIWTTADQTGHAARLRPARRRGRRRPAGRLRQRRRCRTGSCRATPRSSRWCCAASPPPR